MRVKKVEDTALNDSTEPFSYLDFLYLNSRILRSSWQHARLDQWLDRFLYTEKVTGSNPVSSIFFCPPLPLPAFSRPWAIFRSTREVYRTIVTEMWLIDWTFLFWLFPSRGGEFNPHLIIRYFPPAEQATGAFVPFLIEYSQNCSPRSRTVVS